MTKLTKLQGTKLVDDTITNEQIGLATSNVFTIAHTISTTSTTGYMAGLNISFTPKKTGIFLVLTRFQVWNNTAADGWTIKLLYGTGTAPSQGDAQIGNLASAIELVVDEARSTIQPSFVPMFTIINGTKNTTYWIDFSIMCLGGGQTNINQITMYILELLS